MGLPYDVLTFGAAVVLAVLHLVAGRMRFLDGVPRSWWLSSAGGASVAYVFLHLLPELDATQEEVSELASGIIGALENHVYLLALVGLAIFYGLERRSRRARAGATQDRGNTTDTGGAAWLSIGSYSVYNAIIGYLLVHREEATATALLLFGFAMGVHFVVNDHGLREHHGDLYHRYGRWICATAVIAGWGIGLLTHIPDPAIGLLIAFIGGGVILNVMKEELPAERESRFTAFLVGATAYSALLLAL